MCFLRNRPFKIDLLYYADRFKRVLGVQFVLEMMNSVSEMMIFVFKMMTFVLKKDEFCIYNE